MRKALIVLFVMFCLVSWMLPISSYARTKKETIVEEQETAVLRGPKKTIAVTNFENKGGFRAEWDLGSGMSEMLTTALVKSDRFIVVERQAVLDILQEQDLGATGRTREAGSAKIGKMLNSQVLVRGAVTEFEQTSGGGGQGFSYAGVSLGLAQAKAHIALNIRLYDTTTGEVIDSVRVEGNANRSSIAAGGNVGGVGFGTSQFSKTPLGSACQEAIEKAVAFIAQKMDKVAWQGSIVSIQDGEAYINAGKNSNVNVGDEFIVYKKGKELIDPESGATLGCEMKQTGALKIQSVEEKFSKATATSGDINSFSKGDIIKIKL